MVDRFRDADVAAGTTPPGSLKAAIPPVDFEALEESFSHRCPYCREKLQPLIETACGLVYVCMNRREHGRLLTFWGGEGGEQGDRNIYWLVAALAAERGLEVRT